MSELFKKGIESPSFQSLTRQPWFSYGYYDWGEKTKREVERGIDLTMRE